jgi:hypothetical protein
MTYGKVHANNQRTFKRTNLGKSPHCGNMDFMSSFEENSYKKKLLH